MSGELPTKPGPDADRIAELEREIAEQEDLAARCSVRHKYIFHGRAQFLRAELARLRNEQAALIGELYVREQQMERANDGRLPNGEYPAPSSEDVREALGNYISAALVAGFADGDRIADYVLSHWPAALAQSEAQPVGRTDAQIVEQTNELARRVLRFQGYEAPKDFRFDSAPPENIRANRAWKFAAEIQEFMTATDVENALANMDEASTAPHRPDASGLIEAAVESASAREIATKIAARPALARLIDSGALKWDEMCDLRDDIEKALRAADRSAPRSDRGGA